MFTLVNKSILLFCLYNLINCISAPSYLSDRGMDARDTVDVGMQTGSMGVALEIGSYLISPAYIEFYGYGLSSGEIHEYGNPILVILFVNATEYSTTSSSNDIETVARLDYRKKEFCNGSLLQPKSNCNNQKAVNTKGRIGIRIGAGGGFRFAINLVEIADFFTGIVGIDLIDDDYYRKTNTGKNKYVLKN